MFAHLLHKLLDPRTPRILDDMLYRNPFLIRNRRYTATQIVELLEAGSDNGEIHAVV